MRRVGRSVSLTLYSITLGVLFLCCVLTVERVPPLDVILSLACFGWFLGGLWISRWLAPLFVSTLTCPGCDEEIDATAIWSCSCGYHGHREQHVLTFRCPKCQGRIGYVNCPRCSATLLLW